jgi:predicted methyltransferase
MKNVLLLTASLVIIGSMPYQLASAANDDRLAAVLAAQPDKAKARYKYRHPQETLDFFGIQPGMTVVDTLPGDVWYTGILLSYLGPDGAVIGADYPSDMWAQFGYDEEFLATKKNWPVEWTATAETWRDDDSASVSAFVLGSLPESMHGTADAVLFVRALHNMVYTAPDARNLTLFIKNAYDILKPGGIVGVVQHQARDNMPDSWADGEMGYLKKAYVIEMMEAAGFEFVAESAVNENSKDIPTIEEYVWRLPPSYDGADTPEAKATVDAIGESNRMTLKFRKP